MRGTASITSRTSRPPHRVARVISSELEGRLVRVNVAGRLALMLLCGGIAAVAQSPFRTISARAGSIGYQQGSVYVDDKRVHSTSGAPPFQMKNGQRLHIDSGRVELLL